MSKLIYDDRLKIEFRAIPYTNKSHVLEYRISPNQDLTYQKEYSFFNFKFKITKKYETTWLRPLQFVYTQYDVEHNKSEDDCYIPLLFFNVDSFHEFISGFQTMGDFLNWLNKHNEREKNKFLKEREKLNIDNGIWI